MRRTARSTSGRRAAARGRWWCRPSAAACPSNGFARHLGKPLVIVPMANSDNNQHAANENLRIQNLWDAIELYATISVRLGPLWR